MQSQYFHYEKNKVIQALRYHFISRIEIKVMMIVVNVFALISAVLFYIKLISPVAFLLSSVLWFSLMLTFWYLLPKTIYKKTKTFQDRFFAILNKDSFAIENERGNKSWKWEEFSDILYSPHFFHLYFNSRSFLLIPKDAFTGEDQYEAKRIFDQKIKNRLH